MSGGYFTRPGSKDVFCKVLFLLIFGGQGVLCVVFSSLF